MTELLTVAERIGVSFALLTAIGLVIWRVVLWCAPRADRVIDSHCNFVHGLAQQVERQTDLLACQTACLQQLAEGQREAARLLKIVHEALTRIRVEPLETAEQGPQRDSTTLRDVGLQARERANPS